MSDVNGHAVTVQDVLTSLNAFFDRNVNRADYETLRHNAREVVKLAYTKRVSGNEVLRSRGIVRRDFLQGRRIVALAPSGREDIVMLVLA